jgi:glycerol kinase
MRATRGNVLALDQGTSGTKALVVSAERGVLASVEVPVRPRYGPGGSVEQDPGELLASVVEAGRRALAAAGETVDAVGLANQGETVLAWDPGTGEPLGDAVVWQDRRSADVCRRMAAEAGWLEALTGLALDPYFAAPKMTWLRENRTGAGVVTTSDVWLVHRLTGAFVTDASTASRTLLLDLDSCAWSPRAAEAFGLGSEVRPEVVDAAGSFGSTGAFGPGAGPDGGPVPLTGLLVDQQAALLGQGCLQPGMAKCTYGTGAFLLANVGGAALRSASGLTTSVAWRLAGLPTYCLDGQVFTVASAVRWLVDLGVLSAADDLDRVGASAAGAGGVTFVPALAGLGGPWWRGDARGALTGLHLGTGAGELVRALVEGIAAQVAVLASSAAADLGAAITSLRVDGGLTRSALLMQAQADLLQVPVEVFASPDATALGVAAAARLGLDPGLSLDAAVPPWPAAAVYEPAVSRDEAAERLGSFQRAVVAVLGGAGA